MSDPAVWKSLRLETMKLEIWGLRFAYVFVVLFGLRELTNSLRFYYELDKTSSPDQAVVFEKVQTLRLKAENFLFQICLRFVLTFGPRGLTNDIL